MNMAFRLPQPLAGLAVAHAVTGYDPASETLVQAFDLPAWLDALALKIAEVPADDPLGALSYPRADGQRAALGFVFGLPSAGPRLDWFLEPWRRTTAELPRPAVRRLAALAEELAPPAPRRATGRITEAELTLPSLRLLAAAPGGFLTTAELRRQLAARFRPQGDDARLLAGRADTHFTQKVRNLISHRGQQESFIARGHAEYLPARHGLAITPRGRRLLRALDRCAASRA